ncbi:MAG: hypothetical protein IJA32_08865 [Lachnospiraceae bacterium]|nr:hypothetical protein [Lachnospiraceae bacterium]
MNCKEDRNVTEIENVTSSEKRTQNMRGILMNTTIIVAGVFASKIIMENVTVFTHHDGTVKSYLLMLLGILILGCSIRCMFDEFIMSPYADRKRQDTMEYAKKVHVLSNSELVRLFIIECCPEVKGVQLQEKNGVFLRGRYTTHFVEFGQNGATITSKKKDYRAYVEANAIMRVLARACN